ncbi:MAG: DNA polymerase I [Bacilli bacterium]|nr:DNA polymerase I [Bacilli bacterium]
MKKVVLVDGNNLLFRSYYATAYTGNIMRNSKGFPTNGLYGFVNMINKIINDEKPEYMVVSFDVGKTFRHDKYEDYKGGRNETPDDLKCQFPVAKEILSAMNIKYLECVGYEADDIIGTLAKMIDDDDSYEGLIVSSDKDLLQLISDKVTVKLLKTKDYIMMNRDTFYDTYGIEPIRMIDLKGLMGDSSDNIPGVKGIGEKTAIKLLKEYDTVDNLYEHVDEVKGAVHNKLVDGKESAFKSLDLATIYKEVPLDVSLEDMKYNDNYSDDLVSLYKELEFNSFIKKIGVRNNNTDVKYDILDNISKLDINEDVSIYIDTDNDNYHKANIIGIGIYGKNTSIYIKGNMINNLSFIKGNICTYDVKKLYVMFRYKDYIVNNLLDDIMIGAYLINYNVKDDICYLANDMGYEIPFSDKKEVLSDEEIIKRCMLKAKFIYDVKDIINKKMVEEEVFNLYKDIEMPLAIVLGKMEYTGIKCDSLVLDKMGEEILNRINDISTSIYDLCGIEFNIASPKQLGEVLFDKLELPHGKKGKSGNYSTDEATLLKLIDYPVIGLILEYRMLTKLHSTYIVGLKNSIMPDGRIHTIYTQTLTRTGRLSSIEPNLQNIPIRNEYGRLIRKSFVSDDNNSVLLSSDYSQIELRLFSHLADIDSMRQAFINGVDIHAKTASDVNHVDIKDVTKDMRRCAKAVNFGIIYGISSFGLASDLGISVKEAKNFRDNYFGTYPGIKTYMNSEIEKVHKDGYVKTIMNRKRIISEINDSNYMIRSRGERMALNTPIQGSAADILKKAMVDIDKEFDKRNLKSKMLLQIHDELVFNVIREEEAIVKEIVRDIMENVYKLSVPLKVDISIGKDLYEAK